MENVNDELIYWGKAFNSEEDRIKGIERLIIIKQSLLEIQEKVEQMLSSKSNKYKKENIIEIWTSTKDLEIWNLISTHQRKNTANGKRK